MAFFGRRKKYIRVSRILFYAKYLLFSIFRAFSAIFTLRLEDPFKAFDSTVKPLNEGHNCCSNCHQACQCSGENCAVSLPVFESVDSQETMTQGERIINGTDIADFESALKELQDNLDGNVTFSILGNKLMTHGFSDNVIKEIVYDVQHIFENYFDSSSGSSGEDELPVSADELDHYFSIV